MSRTLRKRHNRRTKKHHLGGKRKTMNKNRNRKTRTTKKRGGDFFPNVKYSPLAISPFSSTPSASPYSCYYKDKVYTDSSVVNSEDPWQLQDVYVKCCATEKPQKGLFSSKKTVKGNTNPFCMNLKNQYSTLSEALNEKMKKEEYDMSDFGDRSIPTVPDEEIINRSAILSK